MPPTDVAAGSYIMTATDPPGYTLVACHGSGIPALNGLSASETARCPAGAAATGSSTPRPAVLSTGAPSISLHQSAAQTVYSGAGQTIAYRYFVTNTGNGALTHITVSGPLAVSCPNTTLAAGAAETCTATHVTTAADVAARKIVNTATAAGTPPTGPNVTSVSTLTISDVAPDTAGISVVAASIFANYNAVGEHIPFTYDVTNTSTAGETLTSIAVNDPLLGSTTPVCPDPTLAAGASETCHNHYVVTQADLTAGKIVNTVTASGLEGETTITSAPSTVTLVSVQLIAGHIFQCFSTGPTDLEVSGGTLNATGLEGQGHVLGLPQPNPIHPHIPVASGNYAMTATLPTSGGPWAFVSCPDTGPAPATGASADGTTQTLTVPVPNGGTGTGRFYVVHQADALTMKKTAAQPYFSGAGQTITFDFLVTNLGNAGMANVGITDTLAGVTGLTCPATSLGAGASETCTGKYTTTAADVGAQSISNRATAHGTPPDHPVVTSAASSTKVPLLAVTVTKTGSPTSIVAGSTTPIAYTLTVKNTGIVTTPSPLNIADSAPVGTTMVAGSAACAPGGSAACNVAVAAPTVTWTIDAGVTPGQVYTLTFKVTANASDPSGNITNTALWNGSACPAGSCTTDTVLTAVTSSSASHGGSGSGSGSGKLAFTGALLAQQWVVAMAAILLGGGLLVASHRRRTPRHAVATRWGLLEFLMSPRSHRDPSGERKD